MPREGWLPRATAPSSPRLSSARQLAFSIRTATPTSTQLRAGRAPTAERPPASASRVESYAPRIEPVRAGEEARPAQQQDQASRMRLPPLPTFEYRLRLPRSSTDGVGLEDKSSR